MARESKYFSLSLEALRSLGGWAADCAERALSIYETYADSDSHPRAAIEGIRLFAGGGRRTAQLRTLALSAFSAEREADDPAAGDPNFGDGEDRWAIEHVPSEVREVLLQMPARKPGTSRLDKLLYELDQGIRGRALPENG